jgi:hypothetical protein
LPISPSLLQNRGEFDSDADAASARRLPIQKGRPRAGPFAFALDFAFLDLALLDFALELAVGEFSALLIRTG